MSLPSRERGLKSAEVQKLFDYNPVAPLTGAWIEIENRVATAKLMQVAPLTGAWIEIRLCWRHWKEFMVAPLTGAWIEIENRVATAKMMQRRSPHGSVD